MRDEKYTMTEALSSSGMAALSISGQHYQHWRANGGGEQTESTIVGSAAHMRLLEPHLYERHYQCADGVRTAAKKAAAAEAGATLLLKKDFDSIHRVVETVAKHPFVNELLMGEQSLEHQLFWVDADFRCPCKGIVDLFVEGVLVDFKFTGQNARDFEKSIREYRYDRQIAFYRDGATSNGLPVDSCYWVVVEMNPPHGIRIIRVGENALERGRAAYKEAAAVYAAYWAANYWPSYPDEEFYDR